MLTEFQKKVVDGIMLGDGCVGKRKNLHGSSHTFNLIFCQTIKHSFYHSYLSSIFANFNPCYRRVHKQPNDEVVMEICDFSMFVHIRNRWYPENVKIVPPNLTLTPITLAFWLKDDGSLDDPEG